MTIGSVKWKIWVLRILGRLQSLTRHSTEISCLTLRCTCGQNSVGTELQVQVFLSQNLWKQSKNNKTSSRDERKPGRGRVCGWLEWNRVGGWTNEAWMSGQEDRRVTERARKRKGEKRQDTSKAKASHHPSPGAYTGYYWSGFQPNNHSSNNKISVRNCESLCWYNAL